MSTIVQKHYLKQPNANSVLGYKCTETPTVLNTL